MTTISEQPQQGTRRVPVGAGLGLAVGAALAVAVTRKRGGA
jgi:hypothetical protein